MQIRYKFIFILKQKLLNQHNIYLTKQILDLSTKILSIKTVVLKPFTKSFNQRNNAIF